MTTISTTETKPYQAVLTAAESLTAVEQLEVALKLLGSLKKAVGKVKSKAPKADDEPPKAKSEGQVKWHAGVARVRAVLKEDPRYKPQHAMRVASALKEDAAWPETEASAILGAFDAYLAANPDDVGSATSGGSKASKRSGPSMKEMTDEERKAYYKARAQKAAATKAKKKAEAAAAAASGAAAGGGAAVPPSPAASEEDFEPEEEASPAAMAPKPWKHDFGKGEKEFGRIDHAGTVYIFDTKNKLLGAFNEATGKLRKVKDEENPFA